MKIRLPLLHVQKEWNLTFFIAAALPNCYYFKKYFNCSITEIIFLKIKKKLPKFLNYLFVYSAWLPKTELLMDETKQFPLGSNRCFNRCTWNKEFDEAAAFLRLVGFLSSGNGRNWVRYIKWHELSLQRGFCSASSCKWVQLNRSWQIDDHTVEKLIKARYDNWLWP